MIINRFTRASVPQSEAYFILRDRLSLGPITNTLLRKLPSMPTSLIISEGTGPSGLLWKSPEAVVNLLVSEDDEVMSWIFYRTLSSGAPLDKPAQGLIRAVDANAAPVIFEAVRLLLAEELEPLEVSPPDWLPEDIDCFT